MDISCRSSAKRWPRDRHQLVQEGRRQPCGADEVLFDVETDKVVRPKFHSPIAGVLTEVLVPAGQTVKVGTCLAVVEPAGAAPGSNEILDRPQSRAAGDRGPASTLESRVRGNDDSAYPEPTCVLPRRHDYCAYSGASAAFLRMTTAYSVFVLLPRRMTTRVPGALAASSTAAQRDPQQRLSPVVRRLVAEHRVDDPSSAAAAGMAA